MIGWIVLFFSTAIVSFLITLPLVKLLNFLKCQQVIREEGPESHQQKAGTPTMGGIGIILTIIVFTFIFIDFEFDVRYLALVILVFAFSLLGFVDDFIKVFRHHNLGLTFRQKLLLQILIASLFSWFLINTGQHNSVAGVLKIIGFNLATLYFLLSTFLIVGTANATNLTDGLNGLLAGTATVAFLSFAVLSARLEMFNAVLVSVICAGAVFPFLYFNFPKARVFMGDVCSLALGAALAGLALLIHKELLLAVIGAVFMLEALSVILQVGYYKLTHKRIFKMTPLHHHFELCGWPERRVVIVFWLVALVCGVIGVVL